MYLGQVIGTVVASQRTNGLQGATLLLIQPVDEACQPNGDAEVAVDTVRAGVGDVVFLVGSREAALAWQPTFVPIDAAVVGVVDDINAESLVGTAAGPRRATAGPRQKAAARGSVT